MSKQIFNAVTINTLSPVFLEAKTGFLSVEISGVLDGAEVLTYQLNDDDTKSALEPACFRPSLGYAIPATGADKAIVSPVPSGRYQFEITNAGASTIITLAYNVE